MRLVEAKSIPQIVGLPEEIRLQRGPFFISIPKNVTTTGKFSPIESQFQHVRDRVCQGTFDADTLDDSFELFYNYFDLQSEIANHVKFESEPLEDVTNRDIINNDPWGGE